MAPLIAQVSPLAMIDTGAKIILAIGFSILVLIGILLWLFPPNVWFASPRGRCPLCDSPDVRASMSAGIRDWVARLLDRHPYRCRSCLARFLVKGHRTKAKLSAESQ
jgi:hypothetical protein